MVFSDQMSARLKPAARDKGAAPGASSERRRSSTRTEETRLFARPPSISATTPATVPETTIAHARVRAREITRRVSIIQTDFLFFHFYPDNFDNFISHFLKKVLFHPRYFNQTKLFHFNIVITF